MAKKKEEKENPKLTLLEKIKSKTKYKKNNKTLSAVEKEYTPGAYFDSGNIMLNVLISGDWRKGLPSNISIQLLGDSDTGKSLFGKMLAYSASKHGYLPALMESEGGMMYDELATIFDPDQLLIMEAKHVKEASALLMEHLDMMTRDDKIIYLIDSLGNMSSTEEYLKRLDATAVGEVGKKAKEVNALFRLIKKSAFLKDKPMIFINREYAKMDAGKYTAEENKRQTTGGTGNDYAPSISLRFTKKVIKKDMQFRDDEGVLKKRKVPIGDEFTIIVKKSRFVWQNLFIKITMSHQGELNRYSGLFHELSQSPFYNHEGEKQGRKVMRELLIKKDGEIVPYKSVVSPTDITPEDWMELLNNGFGSWINKRFAMSKNDIVNFYFE